MTHIKEVLEEMVKKIGVDTSYEVVLKGNVMKSEEQVAGHAPTIVIRLAQALGHCVAKSVSAESREDAYTEISRMIREYAEKEIKDNEKENIHTDSSDSSVLG